MKKMRKILSQHQPVMEHDVTWAPGPRRQTEAVLDRAGISLGVAPAVEALAHAAPDAGARRVLVSQQL